MKIIIVLTLIFFVQACTTLRPIELAPDALHQRIVAGDIIKKGDDVKIVTADGKHHEILVASISETSIQGDGVDIAINDIISVENREFSWGKTTALVGGIYVVAAIIVVVSLGAVLTL